MSFFCEILVILIISSLSQVFYAGLSIYFSRQLVGNYHVEWQALIQELGSFNLNHDYLDILLWRWSTNDIFTVHSLYEWLEFEDFNNYEYQSI
jgi:hypothetical protein